VNGISFYAAGHDIQGLTNLLFSIFLISQLFSILSMLIIPRFVNGRVAFEARERNSKTYSWVAFLTANIVIEAAWLTLISAILFVCWYYPIGMQRNGDPFFGTAERGGLAFLLIWLFCLWATTLSQAFAAGIENPETAIQMVTLCFWLSLVFCGYGHAP
jgi:ABC-type multidrug transport system permease subunit